MFWGKNDDSFLMSRNMQIHPPGKPSAPNVKAIVAGFRGKVA